MQRSTLDHALALAAIGVPVFVCIPRKEPYEFPGHLAATTDLEAIRRNVKWQFQWARIGARTGMTSGYSVRDIDPKHGGLIWLEKHFDELPRTRVHETISGGYHWVYCHREGIKNTTGKIADGVDTRGEGGYHIWWPAHGCPIIDDIPMDQLAPWPEWLKPPESTYTRTPSENRSSTDRDLRPYALAALRNSFLRVQQASVGTRNDTLNGTAFSLRWMIEDGGITVEEVIKQLAIAATSAGLEQREIAATLASALEGV